MSLFASVRDELGIKIYQDVKSVCVLDGKVYIETTKQEYVITGEFIECWMEENKV